MNFFVWFGIFGVIAIAATVCAVVFDELDILNTISIVAFSLTVLLAFISLIAGFLVLQDEHDIPYMLMENKIRKAQLESYIESVEYPKALEQMYFDDIMKFNRNAHLAEKYGDRWMLRWIAYDPSYVGIESINLEKLDSRLE